MTDIKSQLRVQPLSIPNDVLRRFANLLPHTEFADERELVSSVCVFAGSSATCQPASYCHQHALQIRRSSVGQ